MAKMTYANAIDMAIEALGEGEAVDRLNDLKVQLAKRGSGKRGLTKVQKANIDLKASIVELLAEGDMTATEVASVFGLTCQKVSPQLTKLLREGKAEKVKDGKVERFHLI